MAVMSTWEDEAHNAIRMIYEGRWTWDEFYAALESAEAMAADAPHQLAVLHDMSHSQEMANNPAVHFRNWAVKMRPFTFANVIIGANQYQRIMFQTFKRFAGSWSDGFLFVENIEAARAILAGQTIELKSL
jgi:hypothetical protein